MHIGVDATCWVNRRGFGRFTRELLSALLRSGVHRYSFLIDQDSSPQCDFPAPAQRIVVPTRRAPALAASANGARSLSDLLRMSCEAARHPFDLIFFPAVYSYFPLFPGRRARTVVTFHDAIAERHPELVFPTRRSRLFWKAKCRLALSQADVILTVSEHSKQSLLRHWKLDADRIRLVSEAPSPCFRPLQETSPRQRALDRLGLDCSVPYLIYVGGFSPHKNLPFLLQGFCQLVERPPYREVRLLLAGDYAQDVFYSNYPELRQRFRSSNVVFTGHLSDEDLAALLSGARALVLPSLDEGFGLPAVEAMACGTPVLASRSGSLPEVVGEAGLYFSPHEPEELIQALLRILDDAPLRRRLSKRALQRAEQFSWDRAAFMARQAFEEAVSL